MLVIRAFSTASPFRFLCLKSASSLGRALFGCPVAVVARAGAGVNGARVIGGGVTGAAAACFAGGGWDPKAFAGAVRGAGDTVLTGAARGAGDTVLTGGGVGDLGLGVGDGDLSGD